MSNVFNEILGKIGLKTVRKSDVPTETGGDIPPSNVGSDIDSMTTSVVNALNEGSLDANADSVTSFLVKNGMSQEEAADIANMILDSYFESDNADEPENSEDSPDMPEDLETMKSDFAGFLKQVKKSNYISEINAKGINYLIDEIKQLKEDNKVLKSALNIANVTPKTNAKPVIKSVLPEKTGTQQADKSIQEKREMVQEAIRKSALSFSELTYLNINYDFSENAKQYFKKTGALK